MSISLNYLRQPVFQSQSANQDTSKEKQLEALWNSYYQATSSGEKEKIWRQIKGLSLISENQEAMNAYGMFGQNYNLPFGMYGNDIFGGQAGKTSGGKDKGGAPGVLKGMNPNYERDHAIIEAISDEFDEAIGKALGYGDGWNWHNSHDRAKGLTKRDWAALVASGDERVQILRYNQQTGQYDNVTNLYQGGNGLKEIQTGDFIEVKSKSQGTKTIQAGGDGEINGYDDRVLEGSLQAAVNGATNNGQELQQEVEGMEDLNPNAYAAAVTDAALTKQSGDKPSMTSEAEKAKTSETKDQPKAETKKEDDTGKKKEKKAA